MIPPAIAGAPSSPRLILGIETSCDETAAAIVEGGFRVRSNIIATQHHLHERYAGVVPEIASRAHLERILPVIRAALAAARVSWNDLDAIAVANRPGLIGSLLVGVVAAKAIAWATGKPLIGVDHVEAHLVAGMLDDAADAADAADPTDATDAVSGAGSHAGSNRGGAQPPGTAHTLPALGLVVSGGHTSLSLIDEQGEVTPLGRTLDDAIGEAYDKVGSLLGLPYPGGPKVDRLAADGDEHAFDLPLGLPRRDSLDFSFSGLKTAVLYLVKPSAPRRGETISERRRSTGEHDDESRGTERRRDGTDRAGLAPPPEPIPSARAADLAASFQRAAIGAVLRKVTLALELHPVRTLLVGGGVSANSRLRRDLGTLCTARGIDLRLPPMAYCMDNAAMIAGAAHRRLVARDFDDLSLPVAPRRLV